MSTHLADRIAAAIREADGNHDLGAGALGEALAPLVVALADEAVKAVLSTASDFLDPDSVGYLEGAWGDHRVEEWGM